MKHYMFDTNIFNQILDSGFDMTLLTSEARYFVSHIQFDEIQKTRDLERREQLLSVFERIPQERIPTESAVWDVSRWDEAKWSSGSSPYNEILNRLNKRNRDKPNNVQDALIAETAIENGIALVTRDSDLLAVVRGSKGDVLSFNEFLTMLRDEI